jgi:hypothetical protein
MPFAFMHNKDFSLYMYTPILSPSYILNGLLQSILFSIIGRARELLPQVSEKKFLQHHKSVFNLYDGNWTILPLWINQVNCCKR